MSDYIYHIGNDYDCINKEYVILSTDKGQQITVALASDIIECGKSEDDTDLLNDLKTNSVKLKLMAFQLRQYMCQS